jgi:hypothetical protein
MIKNSKSDNCRIIDLLNDNFIQALQHSRKRLRLFLTETKCSRMSGCIFLQTGESEVVITKGFFSQSTKRCGIVVESDSASLEGSYSDHFA